MSNATKNTKKKETAPPAAIKPRQETFELVDPVAGKVELVGDFTEWQQRPIALQRGKNGTWRATVALEPGPHQYRFLVDGEWRNDSSCAQRIPNGFGEENCVRDVAP